MIFYISLSFLIIYLFFLFRFMKSFYMENISNLEFDKSNDNSSFSNLSVSIIIVARNEEKNIKNLIEALLNQNHNFENIEIILANDQSTDNTENIFKYYSDSYNFIHYFNVEDRENAISPKKNALKQAISRATGDIILLTDADCIPSKNWIRSHISMYQQYPDTDMVAGFSKTLQNEASIENKDSFFTKIVKQFEHNDFLILMLAAQSAIQGKRPFSCSGQNLSYKKQAFNDVNGFSVIDKFISGDDILLMQKFVKANKIIRFAAYFDCYTETYPVNSFRELINQRARWASNLRPMLYMNPIFFMYLLTCFVCIGLMPLFAFYFYLIKILFDYIFIKKGLTHWGIKNKLALWYIISPVYILIVSFLGIFSVYRWKK